MCKILRGDEFYLVSEFLRLVWIGKYMDLWGSSIEKIVERSLKKEVKRLRTLTIFAK